MHFIKCCKACQKVISQCRCPSKEKPIEWTTCDTCKQQMQEYNRAFPLKEYENKKTNT